MAATRDPWWQTARTPRQGFIMGGVWLLFALAQLVTTIQEPRVLSSVLLVLAAVLCGLPGAGRGAAQASAVS